MSHSRWLQLLRFTLLSKLTLIAFAISLIQPISARAFDFIDTDVTEENGIYRLKVSAIIEAHPDYIRYVLADSAHIYRLSPSIIESEVLPSGPADEKRVRTRLLTCTSVFCREIERVDHVRLLSSGDFEAEIIPALSEFKSGKARWTITPMDEDSYVVYQAFLEPDFFIPPVIGTQVARQILLDEFTTTLINIEKIARINAERDRKAGLMLSDAASRALKMPCTDRASLQ